MVAVAIGALAATPATAGAAPAQARIGGVQSCAFGEIPAYLHRHLTEAVVAEQRRFRRTLDGASTDERKRAGRDFTLGVAAYIYGMPTVLLRDTVAAYPPNQLLGLGRLATPESQSVVAPNHDTLYSVARADLADGPLMIDAPDTEGRYSVIQIMDANTNSIDYIGSRKDRDEASATLLAPPGWKGEVPAGARKVESPTNTAWILGRTLVDDAETERPEAQALMRSYALTPLDDWLQGDRKYEIVLDRAPNNAPTPVPEGLTLFDELGAAMALDPPRRERCTVEQLAKAGIGAGETPSTAATGLRAEALLAAREAGERIVDDAYEFRSQWSQRRNDGWQLSPNDTARFGRDYIHRAIVATVGLAANTREEAFYPKTNRDSAGRRLRGKNDYRITFAPGELPPVGAFWSLTVYDSNIFLVPNPIDRYAIGDRTDGLRYGDDGSLTIYLTHEDPGGAKSANWLPTPSGSFSMHLRLYEPKRSAFHGRWQLPTVKRIEPRSATAEAPEPATTGPQPGARSCFWIGPFAVKLGPEYNYAFPDYGAAYWTARYDAPPPGSTLQLRGRFAHARYQSVHSYASGTSSPLDAVNDLATRPDRGSGNPYLPGANRDMRHRSYTLEVSGDPPPVDIAERTPNTLYAGADGVTAQELMYRVYVPDDGRGLAGGAGMPRPTLTLADGTVLRGSALCDALGTRENYLPSSAIPESLYLSLRDQPDKPATFPARLPVRWRAYYSTNYTVNCTYLEICPDNPVRTGGQYSNVDNNYVGAFINREYGKVLVLRGKMPRTPRTMRGEKRMGQGQMRYWSLCQNESIATTKGAGCLFDEQVPLDSHRRFTIVTSRREDRPDNARRRCGVGFIPWSKRGDGMGHTDDGLLLLRNMLPAPGFEHAVQNTQVPGDEEEVMGPYLPETEYTSRDEFESRGC